MPTATNFATPRSRACSMSCDAHHQVVVEEAAGVLAVGADAADDGGEVDDDVGPRRLEHADDVGLAAKIVLAAARHEGRRAAVRARAHRRRRSRGSRRRP